MSKYQDLEKYFRPEENEFRGDEWEERPLACTLLSAVFALPAAALVVCWLARKFF